jgi:hypothetical protein
MCSRVIAYQVVVAPYVAHAKLTTLDLEPEAACKLGTPPRTSSSGGSGKQEFGRSPHAAPDPKKRKEFVAKQLLDAEAKVAKKQAAKAARNKWANGAAAGGGESSGKSGDGGDSGGGGSSAAAALAARGVEASERRRRLAGFDLPTPKHHHHNSSTTASTTTSSGGSGEHKGLMASLLSAVAHPTIHGDEHKAHRISDGGGDGVSGLAPSAAAAHASAHAAALAAPVAGDFIGHGTPVAHERDISIYFRGSVMHGVMCKKKGTWPRREAYFALRRYATLERGENLN